MVAVVAILGVMAVNFGHGEAAMVDPTPTAAVSTTTTAATAATTVSASYQDGTYTGATASHKFGSVQVSVTIKSGKITAVDIPVLPMGDHESANISDYASSELVDLTLAAQSSTFSNVSGATLTTRAYKTSLQSALDQARS